MKFRDTIRFATFVVAVMLVCVLANLLSLRVDLTADKRYTLSEATKNLLRGLQEATYIKVYLDGEMPVGMRPLQRAVGDMLSDMRAISDGLLRYDFVNPAEAKNKEQFYRELMNRGLMPFTVQEKNAEGGVTQLDLFPCAEVNVGGRWQAVNFLQLNRQISTEENVNNAIQNMEYALASAVEALGRKERVSIAFVEGHGELSAMQVADVMEDLSAYYDVQRITLHGDVHALDSSALAVVAKSTKAWSEADKLVVDQFVMRGGKMLWLVESVAVHEDSLANGHLTFGIPNEHNLHDMLFRYGVRINADVVQDLQCALIPVNMSPAGMPAKFSPMPWTYYPLLWPAASNPISRNLNVVKTEFPCTIDTLAVAGVSKEILLSTSAHSLVKKAPFYVSLEQVMEDVDTRLFSHAQLPVAVLLRGEFTSIFQHRVLSSFNHGQPFSFAAKSKPTAQVVVADGDVIRNAVRANGDILPLGYDQYTLQPLYGNKEFVQNVVSYLLDDKGLMSLRSKVVTMRLLDRSRVVNERRQWLVLNTLATLLLLGAGGVGFVMWRRIRYARTR
ncbi:MAG: gliding motility-associated ABC transporter substrate-binding protein GldG [Prevotellaceae bacterium]|jgi:ABC-2 type transport system permease protein|nr:gliding motility-associated ABC transporter substrate-binding protein GldG [Prevotellaceae bacterium]